MLPLFFLAVHKRHCLSQPGHSWQQHRSPTKSRVKYLRLDLTAGVTDVSQKGHAFADACRLQLLRITRCYVRYLMTRRTCGIHARGI